MQIFELFKMCFGFLFCLFLVYVIVKNKSPLWVVSSIFLFLASIVFLGQFISLFGD